mmetsp:Transcript_8718/g.36077  ORF Transcript_8718/g.36077 Transcript_8718/m.36077 type:complete len:96 (-) Transcript_8718:659-946(-)
MAGFGSDVTQAGSSREPTGISSSHEGIVDGKDRLLSMLACGYMRSQHASEIAGTITTLVLSLLPSMSSSNLHEKWAMKRVCASTSNLDSESSIPR